MDGNIGVKSRVGLGTSFTVTISFKINNEVKEPENNEPCNQVKDISLLNKRILLCDDNDLNRVIVFMLLNKYGVIIEEADEGYKAINKFTTSAKGYYDLILMDIQMPGLNGYETSRKIRNSKHPDSLSIPIIALTANAFSEDIEKARAAGMNFHLGKPISNDKLIKAIKKVWDKSEFN